MADAHAVSGPALGTANGVSDGDPAGSPRSGRAGWRYPAAAAAATTAIVHLLATQETWRQAQYLGVAFILVALACGAVGLRLLASQSRWLWEANALVGALVIGAYAWSRASGLPGLSREIGDWADPLGVVAVAAEAAMVAVSVVALRSAPANSRSGARAGWAGSRRLVTGAVVAQLTLAGVVYAGQAQAGSDAARSGLAGSGVGAGLAGSGVSGAAAMPGMDSTGSAAAGMTGSAYWNSVGGNAFHPTGKVRTYYLGADEVAWNYTPTGRNQITGKPFDDVADTYVKTGPGRIGSTYVKCLYRGYTDASFTERTGRADGEAYLGFTGPVIRAEVGDTIKVAFRNSCTIPASVHPHGVFYAKASEGAPYADNTSGKDKLDDAVPTGGRHTYTWLVPDRAGPGPHDGSSVMWMYHSHTNEIGDTYAGLQGFMVITAKGMARADGSPRDVDREVFELFSVMNENNSPYLDRNVRTYAQKPYAAPDDPDFDESNLMHSINGYVFGNQPMLTLRRGQHVRWYVMSMGTEVDLHTPHWHGNDVLVGGMRMDVVSLLPASMVTADMVPDDPGIWLFHCHVNDHLTAGMITRYRVL